MRDLLANLIQTLNKQQPVVFCSVIETRGSTPQKAGAAMLVFPDGSQTGTLGGGCVEAEVKQQALRTLVSADGRPRVFTFNLDDNYGWDDGLICGGRMTILADPLTQAAPVGMADPVLDYYKTFHRLIEEGHGCTEAVIASESTGANIGQRYLFDAAGGTVAQLADGPPPDVLRQNLSALSRRPQPTALHGIAYLPILPRVTLLIVGGGHVGQAVAKLAADVDFEIWVLDDRAAYASPQRFPQARRRIVGDIGEQLKVLVPTLDRTFYCLVITRGHNHDEEALHHLAAAPAGYVGMIGSKRKIKLIFDDLRARGVPDEALARVHAPLGFDIGSQTVPEIAISIVAELIACRNLGAVPMTTRQRAKL